MEPALRRVWKPAVFGFTKRTQSGRNLYNPQRFLIGFTDAGRR
jgi:hypothetical protein